MNTYNLRNKSIILVCLSLFFVKASGQIQIGDDIYGAEDYDHFGTSIALSGNGKTIAVGGPRNTYQGSGHVRVFEETNDKWIQVNADLYTTNSTHFGHAVSLSADGSKLAVGEIKNGRVSVYNLIDNKWVQMGSTVSGAIDNKSYNGSVSLSNDGKTLAIGGFNTAFISGKYSGFVHLYKYINNNWHQIDSGLELNNEDSITGYRVSLSGDGSTVAIGTLQKDKWGYTIGAVHVYRFDEEEWTQLGKVLGKRASSYPYDYTLSLNYLGDILAISSDGIVYEKSEAYVYGFKDSTWSQIGGNLVSDYQKDNYKAALSLSDSGDKIVVGVFVTNDNQSQERHVNIYENVDNKWVSIGKDLDGNAYDKHSGISVSMSGNGERVADGAPLAREGIKRSGRVRVFDLKGISNVPDLKTERDISIYPNPGYDIVNISAPTNLIGHNFSLIDSRGNIVLSGRLDSEHSQINIAQFPCGVYFLRIGDYDSTYTKLIRMLD